MQITLYDIYILLLEVVTTAKDTIDYVIPFVMTPVDVPMIGAVRPLYIIIGAGFFGSILPDVIKGLKSVFIAASPIK